MKLPLFTLLTILFCIPHARGNVMTGFRYTSCAKSSCVEVEAEKAYISQLDGGFTTEGPTKLYLKDRDGKVNRVISGGTLSLNMKLELLTLDAENGIGFYLYSLRNEALQEFAGGGLK